MAGRQGNGLVGRLAALLVLGAILVGGVVAYKQRERASLGRELLAEFMSDVAAADLDARSREYVEGLARGLHEEAYEAAFAQRTGLTGGRINVNWYQREMVDRIIAQARTDGSTHVVKALETFKANQAKLDLSGGSG